MMTIKGLSIVAQPPASALREKPTILARASGSDSAASNWGGSRSHAKDPGGFGSG